MESKIIVFLSSISLLLWCSKAYNITAVLEQFPDFGTFNYYLTQTGIAGEMMRRYGTVTVLAVDNGGMGAVSGKPMEVIRRIMGIHIILDFYDVKKFRNLSKGTARLTTFFQTTGLANGGLGFLNVTDIDNNNVMFGSASNNQMVSSLMGSVTSVESNQLSVMHISSAIVPPGLDSYTASAPSQPPPPPPSADSPDAFAPAPAPSPSSRKLLPPPSTPPPSEEEDDTPPSEDDDADAPSPSSEDDDSDSHSAATARQACLSIITATISTTLLFLLMI